VNKKRTVKKKTETPRPSIPDWKTLSVIFAGIAILYLVLIGKLTPQKINIFGFEMEFSKPSSPVVVQETPTSTTEATTEIYKKYIALGGSVGFLGNPMGPETSAPDGYGRFRDFEGGSIYWTRDTGAHEVQGFIRAKWAAFGGEQSFLGYPVTDELTTPDGVGRFSHFQGGSIYWTPNTGAHEVHGLIRDKWSELGWELSSLGYPTSDEVLFSDGATRLNTFQNGCIYWTPNNAEAAVGCPSIK